MDSAISKHCTAICDQKEKISAEELQSLFNLIVIELNNNNHSTIDDYIQIIDTLKNIYSLTLIDPLIVNNELFHLIRNYLTDLLNKWSSDTILTDKDEYLFHEIVELFSKMIKHIKTTNQVLTSTFQTWFLNELFFKAIALLLEDISINSSKYSTQNQNMEILSTLIQSIRFFQSGFDCIRNNPNVLLLIDPIIHCLCSSTYINTFKQINIKSDTQNPYEEFILEICPCYCIWHRGKSQLTIINQLCLNNMLNSYQEIYELFLPTINQWQYSIMQSMFYMTALLRYVAYYPSTQQYLINNLKIIDSILILLNNCTLLDNILTATEYNSKTNLTDSAISFIFNLSHDFQFLSLIKENSYFSKDIFLKLKHANIDRVKLHAFMILAKILNEKDILTLDNIDILTTVFINYLYKAINDPCHSFQDVPVEHLLTSLKAFVQHDEIKDGIAKQNYFEILIRCATQTDLHVGLVLQTSLEIIWSLTFNKKIHQLLITSYDNFIRYLKTVLVHSTEEGVQAAAKGVLWKLENELIITKQLLDKNENTINNEEKYDIMISYSHSNKDLCLQIYESLIKLNYRVWLDFENMYGSTLQSMATAIELSDMVIICMYNPYKQSAYCRSEAEYAYTRQRHIIPLVIEKKYRRDGWLGIICASKMYDKKNELLIHVNKTSAFVTIQENTCDEQTQVDIFTHEDVLNFLHDKHLHLIRTLFEYEQQFDGHSLYILYKQCQSNTQSTYQVLNTQLNQLHDRTLPYFTYIHFVSELEKQFNPLDIKQYIHYLLWIIYAKILQKFFKKILNN
ncbi:unnamed protein product [Adineta steineri]|uniref:TIR domain-containing protein n=1 Tax=Adineta steineri TaxID=433720 RepID=A0A815KYB8_9BILA|nr:unnamed protein product [Adineta steineri]